MRSRDRVNQQCNTYSISVKWAISQQNEPQFNVYLTTEQLLKENDIIPGGTNKKINARSTTLKAVKN